MCVCAFWLFDTFKCVCVSVLASDWPDRVFTVCFYAVHARMFFPEILALTQISSSFLSPDVTHTRLFLCLHEDVSLTCSSASLNLNQ